MPKPIDVVLCITDLEVGGAERCLYELVLRLDRERFHPSVVCLQGPPEPGKDTVHQGLEAAGVEVHFLNIRRFRHVTKALYELSAILTLKRPLVFQSFLYHANLLGRFAARRAGVPCVFSGIRVAERRSPWRLRFDRWTDRLVDRHVCVSRSVADFSRDEGGLPESKLVVIPNGVDTARFDAAAAVDLRELGTHAAKVVTFVGRLDYQKGLDWLLETAPRWMLALPDTDLVFVGDGPQAHQLRAIVSRLQLDDRVHFLGRRGDVPGLLKASRLVVLPSRWEGMPNVVLEAMAARLPVLATRAEGVAELLGPGADAQTVDFGDTAALCERMQTLIRDDAFEEETLGEANYSRALEHFTLDAMVREYEAIWSRDLKNRHRAKPPGR